MRVRTVAALVALVAFAAPAMAEDDGEARTIVRLSYLAGAARCAQAGLVFDADAVNGMAAAVRAEADAARMSEDDRNRLWGVAQMMAISTVDADSCGKLREELPTWYPEL